MTAWGSGQCCVTGYFIFIPVGLLCMLLNRILSMSGCREKSLIFSDLNIKYAYILEKFHTSISMGYKLKSMFYT